MRQRIEAVLDYAAAMGARTGNNPARWRGHLDHLLPKPSKVKGAPRRPALEGCTGLHARARQARRDRREGAGVPILTAARPGEVRGITWGEIDDADAVWTVPAARIKAGKEHRVPLTPAARALLGDRGEADDLVFPAPSDPRKMLSDMTLTGVLRRMDRGDLTVHGFRSTFRDWAGETPAHPREVIEAALAHRLKDKAEAAYVRGDLLVTRRRLMEDWAAFLARPEPATVLPLRRETAWPWPEPS